MKKTAIHSFQVVFTLLFFVFSSAKAQDWTKDLTPNSSFAEVQKAFYDHHPIERSILDGKETAENEEVLRFKRFENFMRDRLDSTGHFPSGILFDEYSKAKTQRNRNEQIQNTSNWSLLGPMAVPGQGGGVGRINTLAFDPNNSSTYWIGAANGGLWKTTNAGASWTSNTDFLPTIGIADIAIDPSNTNNMYIATGDAFGYEAGNFFWGGTYTAGILKSTDGGMTWNTTGFTYAQSATNVVQRMVLVPSHPQILIAAARDGLWRSTDAGATWSIALNKHVYDIEFNQVNDSIIFCSGNGRVYRSLDAGATWMTMPQNLGGVGRISIAVTASDTSVIYALKEDGSFFRSSDGGVSFTLMTTPPGITLYGYYDIALAASPTNPNIVCVGGLQIMGSSNGGNTWYNLGDWLGWPSNTYVHADNHLLKYYPGNGNILFSCDDGGIFRSNNGGNNWTNISGGITISQYYRIAGSATDPNIVYCGQQDNGTVRRNASAFDMVMFADGMESIVDFTNPLNVITTAQNGYMQKSNDGAYNFVDVTPSPTASWITPIATDQNDPYHLIAGYEDLYESTDGGWNWGKITFNLFSAASIDEVAIASSNPQYIYAGTVTQMKRSSNGGMSWTNITPGLPTNGRNITSIVISNTDPLKVWVTIGGYLAGNKVFATVDGGTNWTNISGSLPNVPADAITRVDASNDELYIGMDFGVYYKNASMSDWVLWNTNLPNVIVDELEINYATQTIRAATYGRGLWESPLQNFVAVPEHAKKDPWLVFPNPSTGILNISGTLTDLKKVSVKNVLGQEIYSSTENNFTGNLMTIDLSAFTKGIYFVQLSSANTEMTKKIVLSK